MRTADDYVKMYADFRNDLNMTDSIKLLVETVRKEAIEECAMRVKLQRISDSFPNKVFNTDNTGQLCISSKWAGEYIQVNKQSILSLIEELK